MTPLPPHLPPKASSRKQYDTLRTLPWLLFFVALCALTAIAMSVMLFAWYIPSYVSYQVPTTALRSVSLTLETDVDPLYIKEREQRMFTLYEGSVAVPPKTLSAEFHIAEAISLSSDGFISFVAGSIPSKLIAVSSEGAVYTVQGIRTDSRTGVHYAQVVGEGFRVVPFGTAQTLDTVYLGQAGTWKAAMLESPKEIQSASAFSLHDPFLAYTFEGVVDGPVYNAKGDFVGFVSEGQVIPGWQVQLALNEVLSESPFQYITYPYKVRAIESVYDADQSLYRRISGFEVVSSVHRASETTLAIGDIIIKINGEVPQVETIAEQLQLHESHTMTVLRNGSEQLIEL